MFLNILLMQIIILVYYEADKSDRNYQGIPEAIVQKWTDNTGNIHNLVFTIFAPKARIFWDPMSEN